MTFWYEIVRVSQNFRFWIISPWYPITFTIHYHCFSVKITKFAKFWKITTYHCFCCTVTNFAISQLCRKKHIFAAILSNQTHQQRRFCLPSAMDQNRPLILHPTSFSRCKSWEDVIFLSHEDLFHLPFLPLLLSLWLSTGFRAFLHINYISFHSSQFQL